MAFGRRSGRPSLIQTAARTAVITGTAAATSSAVHGRAARKQAAQQANQPIAPATQPVAPAAAPMEPAPTAATVPAPEDLIARLERLAALHSSGALTDAEFTQLKSIAISGA